MKSLTNLFCIVLDEIGDRCYTSTIRDRKTVLDRVKDEGLSFLTISLSNFGKELEKALDQGYVAHDQFLGFSKAGRLPQLFGGFFELIFDRADGRLLSEPSIEAIRCLRQITLMWAKIEIECTEKRLQSAFDSYIECEQQLRISDAKLEPDRLLAFTRIGSLLFSSMFLELDREIANWELLPKHGPGATAERVKANAKYRSTMWTERLEEVFPYGRFLSNSWGNSIEFLQDVQLLEPGAELPVRVISVPKTQKTPRIIAIEPTPMQYMQQGILEAIVSKVKRSDTLSNLIDWSSQEPNQLLAREGSISGSLATLDLSEASDRVSYQHVLALVKHFPHLMGAVDACRSRKADVKGHGVTRLAKFASMGSALCFPFEAMVFATVIFVGIERVLNRRLTGRDIKSFLGKVRVYGDDIIVPVEFVSSVVSELEAFGFKVNSAKSFWTGKFRESCGRDFYNGVDVSVVRLRRLFPAQRQDVSEVESIVSLRNQLAKAGYWKTVGFLDPIIEGLIPFPVVASTSPALGKWEFDRFDTEKMHPYLQRPLVRAAVVSNTYPVDRLDGLGALMKYFLKRSDLLITDKEHLIRAGRPVSRNIKVRWTPSY